MSGAEPASTREVVDALAAVRARIVTVDRTWTHDVEIVAVTKAFAPGVVETAVDAGCRAIGENYAQELLTKRDAIDSLIAGRRPRIDFIGQLQSNKVRLLAGLVDRWATVDRASLAKEIARRAEGAQVLVQVNSTSEPQKGGCAPDGVADLVERCRDLGLDVAGLLTVGPTSGSRAHTEDGFGQVRSLVDELGLTVCSMGMTGDLEIAVACGATSVRVGSALFGARPPRASSNVHPEPDPLG